MRLKPNHNSVVAKNNSIIDKLAKFELSELRLIAYCLAHYDSRKPNNYMFTAKVDDLSKIFPMGEGNAYRVIRETMLKLAKKPLEFKEGKKRHFWHWFTGFFYVEGDGEFTFEINKHVEPYLLGLKSTFTRYRLKDVYQFRSAATWKLYENLKRWEAAREWSVPLDELKALLGVDGKYARWADFRKWVIEPAINEINKQSDLEVGWEKEKRGRRVVGVVFFIDQRQPDDVINIENPKEGLFKALLNSGVHAKTAKDYVTRLDQIERVPDALKKIPLIKSSWEKSGKPCALQKYLLGAIKTHFFQQKFFDDEADQEPDYTESLNCWKGYNRPGTVCEVRKRGEPGRLKKCQICFKKIPIAEFGT